MTLQTVLDRTLRAFAELDLSPALRAQIAKATLTAEEKSPMGAFADIQGVSCEVPDTELGDSSIIRTLANGIDELGDAILHLKDGRISYIEIALFHPERGWDELDDAKLR